MTTRGLQKLKQLNLNSEKEGLSFVSEGAASSIGILHRAEAVPRTRDLSHDSCRRKRERIAGSRSQKHVESSRIFVGNISYSVDFHLLKKFFSSFGSVQRACVIKKRRSGVSKGFGFVTFYDKESVRRALAASPEQLELEGRKMNVSAAEMSRRAALKKITNEDLENDESPFSLQLSDDVDVSLNDDVLLSIFSYLDIREIISLERVCKRWRSLALCLWKSKSRLNFRNSFSLSQGVLTDKIFDSIVAKRGCRGLKILDLSSCSRCLTDYCLLVIGNTCKNLEELDLSGVSVTVQSVKFLVENCKKLEVVRLRRCFSAGEKCFWWIFRRCPNLRVIDFEGCMKFTGKCFFVAGPNLTTVLLSQCHKVTDDAFQFLNRAGCALTHVDVSGCVQLTDSAAREIVKFPLTQLKMSNCPKGITFGIHGMPRGDLTLLVRFIELKRLPSLVELNVSRNDAVDDSWLSVIAFYCRLLRTLDVSQCRNVTDDGVKCLSNCFLLESLNISLVTSLTDASCIELACLESLRTLSAKHCHFLTSASLSRIVSECTRLENLNVSGCDSIGDKLVDSLLARTSAATTPHKLEVTVSEMSFSERGRKELESLAERSSGLEVFFVISARDNEEIFSDFDSEEEELSDEPENYYEGGDHLIDNDDYEFLTNDDPLEMEMLS